jgi:hypothetical protein
MVGEALAGLSAIKAAFDIAKGLKDINDATIRNAAIIELQEKILTAQQTQSALVNTVGNLEAEVRDLKNWEADRKRYELTDIRPGVVALSIKESMRNGEPFHRICADCASRGKKAYLQQHVRGPYYDEYQCGGCGFKVGIDKGTPPSHEVDREPYF